MDHRVVGAAETLRLNTRLFRNCLHGMTQAQAEARPSASLNSAIWVATHMTRSRYNLLKRLGVERPVMLPAAIMASKRIDDIPAWPPLAEVLAAWTDVSHGLRDRLPALTAAQLDAKIEVRFPVFEQTELGVLVFLVQHDSYHLGQLSVLRMLAGLPGMSYTEP